MKRTLLGLGLLALAASAPADILQVSAFGGYTSLGMKELNDTLKDAANATPGLTATEVSSGYVAGVDVRTGLLIPVPFMEIGPRLEYIGSNQGGLSMGADYIHIDGRLINAMLGINLGVNLPLTGLGLGLGAYAGYGLGNLALTSSPGLSGMVATENYSGQGLVYEVEGRVNYKLVSILNLYGFAGYRMANLGQFKDPAGDAIQNTQSQPMNVDFSGFTAGLGLNLDF